MTAVFEPGYGAPSFGVFKVVRERQHAQPHYVTALYGDHTSSVPGVFGQSQI